MQVDPNRPQGCGTVCTGMNALKQAGLRRGLYAGLSAAFLRQWTYDSARMGIYSYLLQRHLDDAAGRGASSSQPSFGKKISFGMCSGGIGSFLGTPAELALVRLSADAKLPLEQRRVGPGGGGVLRVLGLVLKERGVLGMWQ